MDLRDPGTVAVAPARTPNVVCHCGKRFSWKQIKKMTTEYTTECSYCGGWRDCFSVNVEVRNDNKHLLYETPRYWWHITELEDWATNPRLTGIYVHVGTAQTARTYHDILFRNRDWKNPGKDIPFIAKGFHLYRVELSLGALVNEQIAIDRNSWPILLNADKPNYTYKYVNHVEVPGSISLLVPYADLTNITEVSTFSTRPTNKEA